MRTAIRKLPLMIACMLLFALLPTGHMAAAQEPGLPPDGMGPPMNSEPPTMNVNKQLAKMAKRYSLSDTQKEQIRPILEDVKKRIDGLFQDSSLAPEDRFSTMRSIHDDETSRVSAVLNDDQRAKYQKDQERKANQPSDEELGPPPGPPPDSEGGPPPQSI